MTAGVELQRQNRGFFTEWRNREDVIFQPRKARIIADLIRQLPRKELVGDVGCFTGRMAVEYMRAGAATVHGFDLNEECLALAQERGVVPHVWNADGQPCPAGDETYDAMVAADVIEHLVNTDSFADELFRVLKPGGTLIVSTPNLVSWLSRLRFLAGHVPTSYPGTSATVRRSSHVDNNHIRVSTLDEWSHFFQAHGFRLERAIGTSYYTPGGSSPKAQLFGLLDWLALKRVSLAGTLVLVLRRP